MYDDLNQLMRMDNYSKKSYEKGYRQGYIDAITNYAVWRDGEQYVGVLQTPLKEVIEEVKEKEIPIKY